MEESITGGTGADWFVFYIGDSSVGIKNRDVITDFDVTEEQEIIDLSAIANGKLSFEGTKSFSSINGSAKQVMPPWISCNEKGRA